MIDWYQEECVDCREGVYDVDAGSCTCSSCRAPCPSCEDGFLVCDYCGEEPPCDDEDFAPSSGMVNKEKIWDSIHDICRGR